MPIAARDTPTNLDSTRTNDPHLLLSGFLKMGTKSSKSKPRNSKVAKTSSKSRLNQKAKISKAQIDKLNKDVDHIEDIHKALALQGQVPKKISALSVGKLKEDMKKDEERKKANEELKKQLELMTGMAL